MVDLLAALEAGHVPLSRPRSGLLTRHEFLRGTWPQDIAEAIEPRTKNFADAQGKAQR